MCMVGIVLANRPRAVIRADPVSRKATMHPDGIEFLVLQIEVRRDARGVEVPVTNCAGFKLLTMRGDHMEVDCVKDEAMQQLTLQHLRVCAQQPMATFIQQ